MRYRLVACLAALAWAVPASHAATALERLDQTALRQRYPDRTHYAIVHGNVRPYLMSDGTSTKLYGVVTAVSCETINVPLQFRGTVPYENKHPFNLKVAFGSHLEPWIVSGHAGPG